MSTIRVTPADANARLAQVAAGDEVVLTAGDYREPLRLSDKAGAPGRPIVLRGEPGALLTMSVTAEDFRIEANWRAKAVQDDGKYPGLWPWIMDGRLILEHCQHIKLDGLHFEKSWPTHIAIANSQDIEITQCDFTDATFAIGAIATQHITISHCCWLQDRVAHRIWTTIPWSRIHGAPPDDPRVEVEHDWRLFDGDFFRGDGIKGGVTVDHCRIGQAFNAVHLFNDRGDLDLSRDVEVRNCTFFEIRDNVLEAETVARNWWFHHNRIFNAHKWFSFECTRSSHFYLFGNLAWFDSVQGPAQGDDYRGGGVLKLAKSVKEPLGACPRIEISLDSKVLW